MTASAAPRTRVSGPLARSGAELAALITGAALRDGAVQVALLVDGARAIRGARVDSRLVADGEIFFALPGERTDGRLHMVDALERGAAAVVAERPNSAAAPHAVAPHAGEGAALDVAMAAAKVAATKHGATLLLVDSGVRALAAAATSWRARFDLDVIGVTGSVGKTTTKELIAAALGGAATKTSATPGNANNEIGLPLALLNLPDGAERLVAEMGMYVGGDIADLCAMARPRVGVVTAIDAVHASRAGDLDAIAAAKGELIAALPADGCAVLNADDARVLTLAARGPAPVISAGSATGATVRIERVELDQATAHTLVTVATEEGSVTANLPLFGLHFASGAALAIATAGTCGVPAAIAAERLSNVALPSGRATVRSVGGVRLIDDAYNAAPSSMRAALATLAASPARRFAALGAMGELGDYAAAAHLEIGRVAASSDLEFLIVLGDEADGIAEGARLGGMPIERIIRLSTDEAGIDAAAGLLRDRVSAGDSILVKASRASELERLVSAIAARLEAGA